LHQVSGDRGGQTYAGIARNFHSRWPGWSLIDEGRLDEPELTTLVRNFYQQEFWDRIKGNAISQQLIAESIFDFGVNAGVRTASKLAQLVVETTPDGHIGPATLEKLNQSQEEVFVLK
jgi:lysozyme family protein